MSVSVIKLSVAYLSGVTAGVQICQRCLVSHAANYCCQARNWREISALDGIQSAFGTKWNESGGDGAALHTREKI